MSNLNFNSNFIQNFPPELGEVKPRLVTGSLTSWVQPKKFNQARPVLFSESLSQSFSISGSQIFQLMKGQSSQGQAIAKPFIGRTAAELQDYWPKKEGPWAWATRYGGHQFGHWAGQLGDGRAMTLGFFADSKNNSWEWQLKGSGLTPYSRMGDGLAVMRSSYREFIASEALNALRVPTTRALGLISTGEWVVRDFFYDGRPKNEVGAVCLRLAPSFLRFGHFQILQASKEKDLLLKLFRFLVTEFYSDQTPVHPSLTHFKTKFEPIHPDDPEAVIKVFKSICSRTVETVLHWWRVGFIHGVMNTDNMSIHGLTIDYGPFGWLSNLDLRFTPNTSDFRDSRYAFGEQPGIALWNLSQLASSLALLGSPVEAFEGILKETEKEFEQQFLAMILRKLGLGFVELNSSAEDRQKAQDLVRKTLQFVFDSRVDFTFFWRSWAHGFKTEIETQWKNRDPGASDLNLSYEQVAQFELSQSELSWLNRVFQNSYGISLSIDEKAKLTLQFREIKQSIKEIVVQSFQTLQAQGKISSNNEIKEILLSSILEAFELNPRFIPRNHLLFQASQELEQEFNPEKPLQSQDVGSAASVDSLTKGSLAGRIYSESLDPYRILDWEGSFYLGEGQLPEAVKPFYEKTPDWALNTPGCNQLSCSS